MVALDLKNIIQNILTVWTSRQFRINIFVEKGNQNQYLFHMLSRLVVFQVLLLSFVKSFSIHII